MQTSSSSASSTNSHVSSPAGLISLASDCEKLLYNSDFWDVCFVCQDGETVHANRAFLAIRSDFFRGLLYGGLQEAAMAKITLSEVKAAALRAVLHFLHTLEVKCAGMLALQKFRAIC